MIRQLTSLEIPASDHRHDRLSMTAAADRALRALVESSIPTISWTGEPERRSRRKVRQVGTQEELAAVLIAAFAHIQALEAELAVLELSRP